MTSPYMQGRYNQITRKPIDATPLAFAPAPRSPMDPRPTAPYAQMSIPTMPTRSPYAPRMPQGSPGKVVPWQQPTGMWRFPPQKSTPAIPTPPWVTKPRIIYRGGRKYTIVPLSFWHRLFGGKRWRTYADNGQVVDTSFDPGTALDAPAGVFAEVGGASAATDAAADVPEETPTIFGVNRNYVIAGAIGVLILGGGGAAFAFSKKGA